jgi:hypothetical protein
VRQPVALPAPKQQKIPIKMQQPPATQQSTTIWAKSQPGVLGKQTGNTVYTVIVHLFRYNNFLPREDTQLYGIFPNNCIATINQFIHIAWTKHWRTNKLVTNYKR